MTLEADIVVIGGGAAGIAAAVAGAYEKRKVMLLDRNSSLGGDSVVVNVGTICGAFYRTFSHKPTAVGYSFSRSFLSLLHEADKTAYAHEHAKGLYVIPYERAALLSVYEMILKKAGVRVFTGSQLEGVRAAGRKINSLQTTINGMPTTLRTQSVVDCSGNAIVSRLAGIDTHQEKSYQAAAQIFRVTGITGVEEFTLNMAIKRAMVNKAVEMNWPKSYSALSIVPGSLRNGKADLKLTLPEAITADTLTNQLSFLQSGRRVREIFAVLKTDVGSFRDALLDENFPDAGVRVLQRSKGKYTLTESDVLSCRKSDTSIAIGTWPIEEWDNDGRVSMEYFEPDTGYSIPAECCISDTLDNLFFAGKNISATSRAVASARVIGTGLQTGFAAGKLACSNSASEQNRIVMNLRHELGES